MQHNAQLPSGLSVDRVQACLTAADTHGTEGSIALLRRRDDDAIREAVAWDELARDGAVAAPLHGLTLTVKACFDVAGWVTHAGSRVLADADAAVADAPMVSALRSAGAILIAQTNMTEFAYGALGLNDTYGTPSSPFYPLGERVSGGSTSGGAVAVALGMADISLGSDTSGSARIPAAFCGVAGFKPSRGRYPDSAMVYLAPSFDVPGFIAPSAAACRRVDAALTRRTIVPDDGHRSLSDLRFVVPDDVIADGVDPTVLAAFESWVDALADGGAQIVHRAMPCLSAASTAAREGMIIATEAYLVHRDRLHARGDLYDPRVGQRILLGADVPAHVYANGLRRLRELSAEYHHELDAIHADAVLTPTVPTLPPRVTDLQTFDAYLTANAQAYRITEYANRLDLASISIPGDLNHRRPVGLLLTGRRGHNSRLLDMAVRIEDCLTQPV
jgi:amidase/aspartyl-tRNA(Asn)/glutamyl-tRNA(Gln) amidotransferase subunit A